MRFLRAVLAIAASGWAASAQMLTVVSVSGHPFSGDEVTVEKHASNVIGPVRDGTVRVYRDSVGRTRFAIPIPISRMTVRRS